MIDCEHATAQRVVSLSFPVKLKKKKKKKNSREGCARICRNFAFAGIPSFSPKVITRFKFFQSKNKSLVSVNN